MRHTTARGGNRRGFTAAEWIAMIAVFVVGAFLGLWATGGLDLSQARASAQLMADRTGVDLAPLLGRPTTPVGAELRAAVAGSEQTNSEGAPHERRAAAPVDDGSSLRDLATAVHEADRAAARGTQPDAKKSVRAKKTSEPRSKAHGAATLAYWNELNRVMAEEVGMRSTPAKLTADNANGFVSSLAAASAFAASSIRDLERQGVDPAVVKLGEELADWYDEGAALNGEAQYLMNEADPETRRGARGKSWENAERAHQKRCEEINRRGAALRQEMSRKYGLDFPELQ